MPNTWVGGIGCRQGLQAHSVVKSRLEERSYLVPGDVASQKLQLLHPFAQGDPLQLLAGAACHLPPPPPPQPWYMLHPGVRLCQCAAAHQSRSAAWLGERPSSCRRQQARRLSFHSLQGLARQLWDTCAVLLICGLVSWQAFSSTGMCLVTLAAAISESDRPTDGMCAVGVAGPAHPCSNLLL